FHLPVFGPVSKSLMYLWPLSIICPSAGPGATDMTNHVVSVAKECPNTVFVLGGYSQGASVTATLGSGGTIPENLAPARRMDPSTA
ncbi:hypothetical protein PF008_g32371, partial [Phytophthora fragariae]